MSTSTPHTDPDAERLAALVDELVRSYEALVALADERLDAIRTSEARRLASCVRRENQIVQRVAEIERERMDVVASLARTLGSDKGGATRVTWIARRIEGDVGEPLLDQCARLRSLGEALRAKNAVAKTAAEHLAGHMTGLLQAVARHLNHAKTYSRNGGVDAGARVVSSLDIST